MSEYKAVGAHVFAGGFTVGVQRVFHVTGQLERHGFGGETCEAMCQIPFINEESGEWPEMEAQFCYGNPRCTGFSTITAGYGDDTHGPWSKQCQDIHDLCNYAVGRYDIIIWESVQQAFSTGRPLLDFLRDEVFVPKHYRIAHILCNAASFGNAQQRKRYFFVAYRDDRNFNIAPPEIDVFYPVLYDAIYDLRNRETHEGHLFSNSADYDFDTYTKLTNDEKVVVPMLPNGWCLNRFAQWSYPDLPKHYKALWDMRTSPMPFSMHCIYRTNWLRPCPTIHSSASRFIHPLHNRPLTVGEVSTVMGWPDIPRGPKPIAQIAKGVVPAVGEWLAQQAKYYLDGAWGSDDFESTYNPYTSTWEGRDTTGEPEKIFNLTQFVGHRFDRERYNVDDSSFHKFNVDYRTKRLIRSWEEVKEQVRRHGGVDGVECNLSRYIEEFSDLEPESAQP